MEWLQELRTQNEMTQDEIAKASGVRRASYGNIENGKRHPSVPVAKRIADVLGFDWTRFFDVEEQSKKTAQPNSGEAS